MVSTQIFWKQCLTFLESRNATKSNTFISKSSKMGSKIRKREREADQIEKVEEAPAKRRRQSNTGQVKLSKLYADLAAEEDDVRLEAAKQIIVNFSPENKPSAKDVEDALVRLIKGLCSQRKAARVGFSLTLTELLRQRFAATKDDDEDSQLDAASVIKMVEEKTKAKGNVPGKVGLQIC
jgi:hypothetical protein